MKLKARDQIKKKSHKRKKKADTNNLTIDRLIQCWVGTILSSSW